MTNPPWSERGPDDSAIDAAFAEIVAGWNLEVDPHRPGSPAAPGPPSTPSDGPPEPPDPSERSGRNGPSDRPGAAEPAVRPSAPPAPPFAVAPEGWRVHVPPEDDERTDDDFEPPDPPLPRGEWRFWVAVLGLVLGPVVLIAWALTGPHSTSLPYVLAGVATIAGFVALMSGLPEQHDEDDDGARV